LILIFCRHLSDKLDIVWRHIDQCTVKTIKDFLGLEHLADLLRRLIGSIIVFIVCACMIKYYYEYASAQEHSGKLIFTFQNILFHLGSSNLLKLQQSELSRGSPILISVPEGNEVLEIPVI